MNFKQRLLDEYNELTERIEKLHAFSTSDKFSELNNENRFLLLDQHQAMINYQYILYKRLELQGDKITFNITYK